MKNQEEAGGEKNKFSSQGSASQCRDEMPSFIQSWMMIPPAAPHSTISQWYICLAFAEHSSDMHHEHTILFRRALGQQSVLWHWTMTGAGGVIFDSDALAVAL